MFDQASDFEQWFDLTGSGAEGEKMSMVSRLHRILRPFLLRRLKSDVEATLLPKIETNLYVGLSAMQRSWYAKVLSREVEVLNGSTKANSKTGKLRLLNIVMQLRYAHLEGSLQPQHNVNARALCNSLTIACCRYVRPLSSKGPASRVEHSDSFVDTSTTDHPPLLSPSALCSDQPPVSVPGCGARSSVHRGRASDRQRRQDGAAGPSPGAAEGERQPLPHLLSDDAPPRHPRGLHALARLQLLPVGGHGGADGPRLHVTGGGVRRLPGAGRLLGACRGAVRPAPPLRWRCLVQARPSNPPHELDAIDCRGGGGCGCWHSA